MGICLVMVIPILTAFTFKAQVFALNISSLSWENILLLFGHYNMSKNDFTHFKLSQSLGGMKTEITREKHLTISKQ